MSVEFSPEEGGAGHRDAPGEVPGAAKSWLIVYGPQLLRAADLLTERGTGTGRLACGVEVTPAQLRKAGEILRDGPQPICNGIKADMPGFIYREAQTGKSLTFQVGILPPRLYRIDRLGRARQA